MKTAYMTARTTAAAFLGVIVLFSLITVLVNTIVPSEASSNTVQQVTFTGDPDSDNAQEVACDLARQAEGMCITKDTVEGSYRDKLTEESTGSKLLVYVTDDEGTLTVDTGRERTPVEETATERLERAADAFGLPVVFGTSDYDSQAENVLTVNIPQGTDRDDLISTFSLVTDRNTLDQPSGDIRVSGHEKQILFVIRDDDHGKRVQPVTLVDPDNIHQDTENVLTTLVPESTLEWYDDDGFAKLAHWT